MLSAVTNDLTALLAPISDSAPAGADVTRSDEFERVKTEIDTLADPLSGRQPDWAKVAQTGQLILSTRSKDFIVAARVCAAWCVLSELKGLADSAKLLTGLVNAYWTTGFPTLKRIRGRRNAIAWWLERVTTWFDAVVLKPVEPEFYQTLLAVLQETDAVLSRADPEAPLLRSLIERASKLDVIAPPPIEPLLEAGSAEQIQASGSGADDTYKSSGQTRSQSGPTSLANGSHSHRTDASQVASFGGSGPQLGNLTSVGNIDDFKDVMSPVIQYLGEAGQKLLALQAFNPMGIQLTRFGARGTLLDLPEAHGSVTRLPPPAAVEVSTLATIQASGNAEGLIGFCEGRLARYPFWLDLDRHSSQAYASLGVKAATMRQKVVDEALSFVQRLEGVELLMFSNNMPFADNETRTWLKSCQSERSSGQNTDAFGRVHHEAMQTFNAGSAEAAVNILQTHASNTASGRDQFRAKLAIAELAGSMRKETDMRPLVAHLLSDCQRFSLADWDPELTLEAWRLKLRAARHAMTLAVNKQVPSRLVMLEAEIAEALMQISIIDMQEAIRLS